ncbi:MAG: hypothetical protein EBZ36_04560 [Acidobacteria bacterium]|nr:hypothetical protein [Acidobacteriota bacterium]
MEHPIWNFEQEPTTEDLDETAINLRAYFDRLPDARLQQYDPSWSDEELIEWDGNFKDDGTLMMFCCERDIGVNEYRRVLELCRLYRDQFRGVAV